MKHTLLSILLLPLLLFTGCYSYPPNATKAQIWTVRYNNTCVLDNDPADTVAWKITKHVFFDIITLGIAETRYAQIRRNYNYWKQVEIQQKIQEEEERRFRQRLKSFVGKKITDVLAELGPADRVDSDGGTGKIYTYEAIMYESRTSSRGYGYSASSATVYSSDQMATAYGSSSSSLSSSSSSLSWRNRIQVWLNVDKDGIIYATGTKTRR